MTSETGRAATPVPVVIVGAGPTGLTAALLLAREGVRSLVLERWPQPYPQPRAVHLDGEIRRILDRIGVGAAFDAISRPALGLRLLDRDLRVLAEFGREPVGRHGHPEANMFDQPDLEALLRAAVLANPLITVRAGAELTRVERDTAGVTLEVTDAATHALEPLRTRYLLGCDGANSTVRRAIGARMRDLGFSQRWLVLDVATDVELGHWEGVHQVCDPNRAATYMRIGATRHRWEFRLLPGENAASYQDDPDQVWALLAPWIDRARVGDLELMRVAEYTFRAQLADDWRAGPVFLLGDAAHLSPPFIGQGMGAGLRDAANLTWKLAAVLRGELPDAVLDSYQCERKAHVRRMIRLAQLVGAAMTAGGAHTAALRDALAPRLHRLPGLHAALTEGRTPPLRRSALNHRPHPLTRAGCLVPNDALADGHRFDDRATGRYTVLTTRADGTGALVAGPALRRWLHRRGARYALIRPDGVVQATGRRRAELRGKPHA
ncbi:bifunctional 3-(3-hydroxy-phenyl)propionate/3-hydroxycinnamic acid hydroxylase [Nocardia sp. NPDC050697]|uniref:bifunctional 3-(3-hydroxy-phenyl)propionate/3-hydroxycinnamic acid hydroxylase n=1 Tax=Nocardia sp. NPDC050697 TaxID=3155158 RepID=UPI0033EF291A